MKRLAAWLPLAVCALALAGCAAPEDGPRYSDACQRTLSRSKEFYDIFMDMREPENVDGLGNGKLEEPGPDGERRPLAALTVRIAPDRMGNDTKDQAVVVVNGRLHLRFEDADTGARLGFHLNNSLGRMYDSWTFGTGAHRNMNFTVPFDGDGVAAPVPVRAVWTLEATGEPTQTGAVMRYSVNLWYQDCP